MMPRGDNFKKLWETDPERMLFYARKGLKKYYEIGIKNARNSSRTLRSKQASSVKSRKLPVTLVPVGLKDRVG